MESLFPLPKSPSPIRPLESHEIFRIGFYAGKGESCHQIALRLGRHASTISRAIHKFLPEKEDSLTDDDPIELEKMPFPHPVKAVKLQLTALPEPIEKLLLRHYLIYIILKNPCLSLRTIAKMMAERKFHFARGKTQIGAEFEEMHFRSIRRIPRPMMTNVNREYRLYFVQAIRTDFRMLLPWLFTDEASITRNDTQLYVWRIPGILDNEDIFVEKKQFPMRIMVWGAVARNFKSELVKVQGILNAESYGRLVVESGVIDQMNSLYGKKAWVFQDDGASAHRAKKARAFLAELCHTLSSDLHWPANSPDLNVIENLWGLLKHRMTVSNCQTEDDLWREAQAAWNTITIEEVNNLIDSFHNRLRSVAALDGQALTGHRNVQLMVNAGQTVEEICTLRRQENEHISRFCDESRRFFDDQSWEICISSDEIARSRRIIQILPESMRRKVHLMTRDVGDGMAAPD